MSIRRLIALVGITQLVTMAAWAGSQPDPIEGFLASTRMRDLSVAINTPHVCPLNEVALSQSAAVALARGADLQVTQDAANSDVAVTVLGGVRSGNCFAYISVRLIRQHLIPFPDRPGETTEIDIVLVEYGQLISSSADDFELLAMGAALSLAGIVAEEVDQARTLASSNRTDSLSHRIPAARSPLAPDFHL